jgi:hypothetical protein
MVTLKQAEGLSEIRQIERGLANNTTGYWFVGKPHPEGMPEARAMGFWHLSGMHSFFIHNR